MADAIEDLIAELNLLIEDVLIKITELQLDLI